MKYLLTIPNSLTHFINVQIELDTTLYESLTFYLPLWRPGRYEMAAYGKNVRDVQFLSDSNSALPFSKTDINTWQVECENTNQIVVKYSYFAFQIDAGSSYVTDELVYINFINCLFYTREHITQECEIQIQLPDNYEVVTSLKRSSANRWIASNYYQLVDSPLMAANQFQHVSFEAGNIPFHLWFYGYSFDDPVKCMEDFRKFSEFQIKTMQEFPENEYHFIVLVLPYKFYHGVEHGSSCMICLGPDTLMQSRELSDQLLGVSSHELFHAWNIVKIRPVELLPYDFNRKPFFNTGFVAEGFTTYFGDLFLIRSGVRSLPWYCQELSNLAQRHFTNLGRLSLSVTDSSYDLSIDGYQKSAPGRKSSVYVEGAIIGLMLDLTIQLGSNSAHSLADVMKDLYYSFAKNGLGYSVETILSLTSTYAGKDLSQFFDDYITGTSDTYNELADLLTNFGLLIKRLPSDNALENYYGIKLSPFEDGHRVAQIIPGSPGESYFSINDELIAINDHNFDPEHHVLMNPGSHSFKIRRNGSDKEFEIYSDHHKSYSHQFEITPEYNSSVLQLKRRNHWLSQ